jgi:hypothetical protein
MRIILFLLLSLVILNSGISQSLNYQEVFGEDWKKAIDFEKENRNWMKPLITGNNISYPLAIAVIFPELVRFSALREKMEVTLLKALYVNLGDDYADFSIGFFQMKPSFAGMIREQANSDPELKSEVKFKGKSDYADIKAFRKEIIADLEDPKTQLIYLIAFLKICEKRYPITGKDEEEKIKFISTAYNYGIDKSSAQIEAMIEKKFFNTRLYKTENYSYAEVSLFWYKQYLSDK